MVCKISWFSSYKGVNDSVFDGVFVPFVLPDSFKSLLKDSDGGIPNTTDFEYFDSYFERNISQAIGVFYSLVSEEDINLVDEYKNPPEFFPENVLAFSETGNGDRICFDYRNPSNNNDPTIVYWNHEANVGKDISFVANNFEEFLSMLQKPND